MYNILNMLKVPERWAVLALVLLVSAMAGSAPAAWAQTQAPAPTVTVALQRGEAVRDCVTLPIAGRRCGRLGRTAVTLAWSATCAAGVAPTEVSVALRRQERAAPSDDDPVVEQLSALAASGRHRLVVEPGQRLHATAQATCDAADGGAPSDGSAGTEVLSIAPALLGYVVMENRICGFPSAPLDRTLQARNWAELVYFPRFASDASSASSLAAADLGRIRLTAVGAGVARTAARPSSRIFDRYRQAGLRVTARRAGRVRLRAAVDGLRTPWRSVRVLPARRACAGGPPR